MKKIILATVFALLLTGFAGCKGLMYEEQDEILTTLDGGDDHLDLTTQAWPNEGESMDDYFFYNSAYFHDTGNDDYNFDDFLAGLSNEQRRFFDAAPDFGETGLLINGKRFHQLYFSLNGDGFDLTTDYQYRNYFNEDGKPRWQNYYTHVNSSHQLFIGEMFFRSGQQPFWHDHGLTDVAGDIDIALFCDADAAEKIFAYLIGDDEFDTWGEWLNYIVDCMDDDDNYAILIIDKLE